jgi:hypothetical protein
MVLGLADPAMGLIVFLTAVAIVVLLESMAMRRCRTRISTWASQNRLIVTSMKRLWFSSGRWGFWAGGRSRRYFDLIVTDRAGMTRAATAKIYGGFGGYVADVIDVRWGD